MSRDGGLVSVRELVRRVCARPSVGRDMSDTRSTGDVSSPASEESSGYCDDDGVVAVKKHERVATPAADRVATERLWEVLKRCSVAGDCGAVQLSGLMDYLLLGFKAGGLTPIAGCPAQTKGLLDCGRCRQTLAGPVTLRCGHTWCWRCLLWDPRCQLCGEETAAPGVGAWPLRSNVILSHLMAKWFPAQISRVRDNLRLEELLAEGRYPEALALVEQLDLKPDDVVLLGYRAESYAGLQLFTEAMEDIEALFSRMPAWPEGYFRKARVLHSMGRVEEAIQSLLQCLALDENFTPAEVEMEKILSHLLRLGPENVKEGLLHNRNKASTVQLSTAVGCCKILPYSTKLKSEQISSSRKGEQVCLELFQSPLSMRKTVGLQRVSSASLFSSEQKVVNMKRKLSSSDQEIKDTVIWKNKHRKQKSEQLCHSYSESILTKDQIDVSDFECSLCMRLFLEPVTTPCGHTFCKGCLERSLDHSPMCPLCKGSLKEYLENRKFSVTCILKELIARYLPEELYERQKIHHEETAELANLTKNVPIFVCTMAYPTVPCPLHVFEPRYRLMIRRCIDTGTKQFGMCISDPQHGFTDYGCMLHIRSIHFLPDGRSVVDTVGGNCFKVLERGQKDGYYTANIEYLKDVKVTGEELGELTDLHDKVYVQACNWFQNLKSRFRNQILQHFGSMPEKEEDIQGPPNGPAWCWWLLAVLPVDPRYQLSVLSMTSLKNRLIKIQNILIYFSSARYRPK